VCLDRRAQRGSRFVGQGEPPNRKGTLFASSAARLGAERRVSPMAIGTSLVGRDAKETCAIMRPMRRLSAPGLRRGGRPGRGRPRGPEPPHGRHRP
jgi:hypothetical protein